MREGERPHLHLGTETPKALKARQQKRPLQELSLKHVPLKQQNSFSKTKRGTGGGRGKGFTALNGLPALPAVITCMFTCQ